MAAVAKNASAEAAKNVAAPASEASQAEVINMVVSDTEEDEEFVGDDLSSFDEGVAPPKEDSPDLIILNRKIQELEEAKKWKQEHPTEMVVVKRPEQNPLHPNVYFDKYMGMKKLKAVEQKLKFARGVLRRFSKKDPKNLKGGNRIKLQRAEKILAKVVADHKGIPYVAPKHEVYPPTMTIEELENLNFKARNRIIIAAKKFVPKIESKPAGERTPWEEVNYPFYKEVSEKFSEPVKPTPEEVKAYNQQKNAIKAERKVRHREDQLDKALNFIDYLLKYKDQPFTPMTKAKLERSFEIIQKQFKFQAAHKIEPSKTQPTVTVHEKKVNQAVQQKPPQKVGSVQGPRPGNQGPQRPQIPQRPPMQGGNQQRIGNQIPDNRKRPMPGPVANIRNNPAKVARNDNFNNNRPGNNNPNFRRGGPGGNQNFPGNNRLGDIWSSVGAALNQLTSQSNFGNNQGGNFNNQPDNFSRRNNNRDSGPSNFNNNISDMLFNRGGGGNNFNDAPRRFNDDMGTGNRGGFNDGPDRFNNFNNDSRDFNRGGGNFNQGNDFRGNNDFGGNTGGNFNGGGFNSGFNSNSGGGYGGLDLNRARASMDDLFTRNRSRL